MSGVVSNDVQSRSTGCIGVLLGGSGRLRPSTRPAPRLPALLRPWPDPRSAQDAAGAVRTERH
jgi:hypothetical protein